MNFIGNKKDVVQFVTALLQVLGTRWQSITVTNPGSLEGCCVSTVIDSSLDDIVGRMARTYSLTRINT